jgi:hypothetical protein
VPFDAVKVFFDPSVPYGLQFEDFDISGAAAQELAGPQRESGSLRAPRAGAADRVPDVAPARAEKKPRAPRRPQPEKTAERTPGAGADKSPPAKSPPTLVKPAEPAPAKGPKVVSIDAFRKK